MCSTRIFILCLLSVSIGITCQAATFERVSSSFSFDYSLHLDCSGADPGDRDWQMDWTETDTDGTFISHTPILKQGSAFLLSLDNLQWAETNKYYDDPGGSNASAIIAMSESAPYYNRVNTYVQQRPVLTFWQPGFDDSYSINMAGATEATVYYRIAPLNGENIGDEIMLTVDGWTENDVSNSGGPVAIPGTNTVAIPTYINLSDSIWHQIDGTMSFTAHIGDTIGMHTSASSGINASGVIAGWGGREYMPCGLSALSWINVSFIVPVAQVQGTVSLSDYSGSRFGLYGEAQIRDSDGNIVESHEIVLDADGKYSFTSNVTGTYFMSAKISHWLSATTAIVIDSQGNGCADFALINGDVDGDNEVTSTDLSVLGLALGSTPNDPNWDWAADLDGDEEITSTDLSILGLSLGMAGE